MGVRKEQGVVMEIDGVMFAKRETRELHCSVQKRVTVTESSQYRQLGVHTIVCVVLVLVLGLYMLVLYSAYSTAVPCTILSRKQFIMSYPVHT